MNSRLGQWFRLLKGKRLIALVLGPSFLALGADAAISHFAGKDASSWAQWIPVYVSPVAALVTVAVALPRLRMGVFRWGLRLAGLAGVAVGGLGTWYHLGAFRAELAKEDHLSVAVCEGALGVAPPMFAPAAFIGVGVLLWFIASPKVLLRIRSRRVPPKKEALAVVGLPKGAREPASSSSRVA